jgi:hypothetical protein
MSETRNVLMIAMPTLRILALLAALAGAVSAASAQTPPPPPAPPAAQAPAQPLTLTVDEFRRELVGIPLCGTLTSGPLAGKQLCTVHLPDGTAVVAGAGLVVRGVWDAEGGKICRRNAHDPLEKRRCVAYERVSPERYKNSDGVEFCLGPCPN